MTKAKILIIEDSIDLADSMEDMLNLKGYRAIKAYDGNHGLALLASEKPDLILLDLKLPDVDGFEVFRRVRKTPEGKDVKILILTASDIYDLVPEDIEIPVENILHKPHWGMNELALRIETELKK